MYCQWKALHEWLLWVSLDLNKLRSDLIVIGVYVGGNVLYIAQGQSYLLHDGVLSLSMEKEEKTKKGGKYIKWVPDTLSD